MKYAVELYFDSETEHSLFHLSRLVADHQFSTKYLEWRTRPHLTLACYRDVNEQKCTELLTAFARSHKPLPARIGSVGMFTDTKTIFASPIMSEGMYRFQRELFECLQVFDSTGYEWYHPNRWVPHCALALMQDDDEEAFYQASNLILHEFRKLSGRFTAIGLVKVTFPVEEIVTVDLAG